MLSVFVSGDDISYIRSDDSFEKDGDRYTVKASVIEECIENYAEELEVSAEDVKLEAYMESNKDVYTFVCEMKADEAAQKYEITVDLSASGIEIPEEVLNAPFRDGLEAGGDDEEDESGDDTTEEEDNRDLTDLAKITFDRTTVIDNDICKIELTGLEYDDVFGYTLEVEAENKTDGALSIDILSAEANGFSFRRHSSIASPLQVRRSMIRCISENSKWKSAVLPNSPSWC